MGKWTRRAFLTTGVLTGGALVVGVALRPGHRAPALAPLVTEGDETLVTSWVKIDPDNKVTAIVAHSEMGQGAQTALMQMLADELDARFEDMAFMEAPAEPEFANWAMGKGFLLQGADVSATLTPTVNGAFLQIAKAVKLQVTGGSLSIRTTGVYGARVAGAAAREMLIKAAAESWGVAESELTAEDTHIIHRTTGQKAPFAAFATAAAQYTPSATPRLKTDAEFKLMGQSRPRFDIPPKVNGTAQFSLDVQVEGMKYASIMAAPVFGARPLTVDDSAVKNLAGVKQVITLDNAVAVVADGYWQANQAVKQLQVKWSQTGHEAVDSDALFAGFDRDLDAARNSGETTADVSQGDIEQTLGNAAQVIEATYRVPFLAHACMEPMNATARVTNDHCDIWVGTQNPLGFRAEVADALGMDLAQVTLHQHFMGGGFGRRSNADYAIQAALLAREAGVPVKLIWSREEDIRHDHYRPAVTSKFKAALDERGQLIGWEHIYHEKSDPAEAPVIPYAIAAQQIHHTDSTTHVPLGPWRSVDHSQHAYFTEAFLDEAATAGGQDPYQFRRNMLQDKPRHLAVLDMAANKAGWNEPLAPDRGRGIALHESFWTIVAQVVEVSLVDGRIKVDRVVCVADPGFAVSPDGFIAQMESGINYGLTAALYGDIQIEAGAVVQSNFHDYPIVRMNEAPVIETHIINSGAQWGGAGEPGTPPIAPALTNAVYAATGVRVRQLPLTTQDINAAT